VRISGVTAFHQDDLRPPGREPGQTGIPGIARVYDRAGTLKAGQKFVISFGRDVGLMERAYHSLRTRSHLRSTAWRVSVNRRDRKLTVYVPAD